MNKIRETLDRTDWALLAKQKLALLKIGGGYELIDGVVHFIDALQDAAEAEGFPVVWLDEADEADAAPSRDERCLAWVERYNAELDAQEIPPNGDDFNEICHGVQSILSTGAEPDIHIKPAGR